MDSAIGDSAIGKRENKMDREKLWRCMNFFVRGLLTDRKYTFAVKAFQADRALFNEFYPTAKHMATFSDFLRIEGTFVSRQHKRTGASPVKSSVPETQESGKSGKAGESGEAAIAAATAAAGPETSGDDGQVTETTAMATAAAGTEESGTEGGSAGAIGGRGKKARGTSKFLVHFVPTMTDNTFGKRPAEGLVAYMKAHGIERLFLVTSTAVTPPAQKMLKAEIQVEYWSMLACLSEAERHYTVPQARRLTVKEKKAFYASRSLTYTNMPRMLVTERMARYWDFQPGDLIHIRRRTHVGVLDGEMRVVVQA